MNCSLGISNFLEEISSLSILLFSSISLHWSLRKAFLSLLAILLKSAFTWVYLSFSPLLFATRVWSLGWEDPLEKKMATHSSTLAWKIPWTEKPGQLLSMGSQRVGQDWATSLSLLFTAICKASSDSHFAFLHFFFLEKVLSTASCTMSRTSVHSSSGTLSDLVPYIYFSLPLYNHKGFDLGHTWMV